MLLANSILLSGPGKHRCLSNLAENLRVIWRPKAARSTAPGTVAAYAVHTLRVKKDRRHSLHVCGVLGGD